MSFAFSYGKLAICIERKKSVSHEKGAGHKDETSNTKVVCILSDTIFIWNLKQFDANS